MKTSEQLIGEVCDLVEAKDETINVFELIERLYNDAYNQGWADCFWKGIKS